jgi:hypothetical protein
MNADWADLPRICNGICIDVASGYGPINLCESVLSVFIQLE